MAPRPRIRLLPRRRQRLQLESLEDRTTPTTNITASGSDFTITNAAGESVNLTVGMTGTDYVLQIAGSTFNLPDPLLNVTLSVGGTKATIPAAGVASWNFHLGDQDDTLVVGTGLLDSFAPVTVDGGGGNDSLTLDDSANSSINTYSISTTNVSRTGGVTVDYSAMDQVSLTAGTGSDIINVTKTDAGTPVTVSGGSGNDTITIGSAGNSLDDIKGAVTVNGDGESGGVDRLNIDDQGDTDSNTYKITATTIERAGAGTITYATVEEVILNATNKANMTDSISVESTASASPVTVNGGDGNDTITIGSAGNSLDDIKGGVTVNGGGESGGVDRLNIDDQGDTDSNTYKITATTIERAGAGTISYATVEVVVLNTADKKNKSDSISVESTASASPVTVNAGAGDDTVIVGNGSLDGLLGNVSVSGGADTDVLTIDDSKDGDGNTYSVGTVQITRAGAGNISYSGFGTVNLTAGSGADTITVPATTAGVTVNVDAGAGSDSITVGGGSLDKLAGTLNLTAGAVDTDTLTIDDSNDGGDNSYKVTATSITRGALGFDYVVDGFEQAVLKAGNGNDTISIDSTASGIPVTVNGGAGSDAVTAATLDKLVAAVSLDGGTGPNDTLFVNDSSQTNGHTYSVSASIIQRTDGTPVTLNYSSFDQVTLSAGSGDDTISVKSTAGGSTLTVNARSGKDTISVAATSSPVTVNAGDDSDSITVGGGSLDNLSSGLSLNAGTGDTDTLTIDDSADTTDNTYKVSATAAVRTNGTPVTFNYVSSDFEQLVLDAGMGADTIAIPSTKGGIPVTVSGGGGNDAISVGPLDAIHSPVTVNGNDGATDSLTVDDSADGSSDTYTVTATQISRANGPVTIDYGTTENITLSTGNGNNTVNLTATAAGTTLTVDTGKGSDTFNAGLTGGLLTDLAGAVSVNAGSGSDHLNLSDQNFGTATTYTVTASQISRPGVTIGYTGQTEKVSLSTGTEANAINILGTPSGSELTVTGGTKDDTVKIGGGTLDNLLGDVTVNAGGATNTLKVDDSADTSANAYTITSTDVTRSDAATLTYSEFSTFSLGAGTGNNTITVTSTATANTTVTGGSGVDTFDITGANLATNSSNTFKGGDENSEIGDTFTVSPVPNENGVTTSIAIVGGNALGAKIPIDTLFAHLSKSQSTPPTFTGTQVTFATGFRPIDYSEIESTGLDTPEITLITGATNDILTITATGVDDGSYQIGNINNKFRNVEQFFWDAGDGDDVMVITNPGTGLFAPVGGITFKSGGQPGDALRIIGGTAASGTFEVGATPGDVRITHTNATDTMTINATGLPTASAVVDSVTESLFTTFATDAADTITVTDKVGAIGVATRVELAAGAGVPIEVLNKSRLEVRSGDKAAGGSAPDTILVNLSDPIGGAKRVDVVGDDGADTISILSAPVARTYSVDGGAGDDTVTIGQAGLLNTVLGPGTITGGTGADALQLDDQADVLANSYTITSTTVTSLGAGMVTYGTVESLVVDAGGANDTFTVNSTPAATAVRINAGAGNDATTVVATAGPLVVDAGDGDDAIAVGTGTLDQVRGAVSVVGGFGIDALSVNDSAETLGNNYVVGASQIARTTGATGAIDFVAVEQVALAAGAGADSIGIAGTFPLTALTVSTGAGDDAVNVGGGSLNNLLGPLTLDAGGGTDTLTVDDSADFIDNTYSVSDKTVARTKVLPVSFPYAADGFDRLVLLAGAGNDSVTVDSTATGIPVTVRGGGGNDTLTVGGTGTLDTLLASAAVDGGTGADRLVVSDANDTTDNAYTVDSTSVSRTDGAVAVGYAALEQVALFAGAGNDTISVPSTAAGVPVSVDGGGGDDVVNVGSGTLDNLLGSLTPDGGAGSDNRLIVDDSSDSTNNIYAISINAVSRSNGTPVVIPYTNNFQSVSVQAGTGDDAISLASAAVIPVSVDGGSGNDSFTLGFLSGSIAGGAGNDMITGDNVGRTYTLTGAGAGSVSGILAAGFTTVENLTAGSADDIFTFKNGGSLSGNVIGGAGQDTLNGDDGGRTFTLSGANAGSVSGLVGSFSNLESLNGGAGNDTLVVEAAVPLNGLNLFNGGAGFDTADLSARTTAQQIAIVGPGPVDGFNITGGSAGLPGAAIVTFGFVNINRVFGGSSNVDILTGFAAVPAMSATWNVSWEADTDDTYTTAGRTLAFKDFEQLVGQGGADDFRMDFSVANAATSRLLLRGGGGMDTVHMIGGTDVNRPDTLTVLPKNRNWPDGAGMSPVFAGLQFNSGQPVLYDDSVEILDLQGGGGDDTFRVDPGPKPPKGVPAIPLYGNAVRTLQLQGQLGADTFAVVPDKFKANGSDPMVTIQVFGGSINTPPVPSPVVEHDQLTLYRLPAKYKANFPVEGKKGPPTHSFNLFWLGFSPLKYFDMWTVTAEIKAPPAA